MKKLFSLLVVLSAVLVLSGCTEDAASKCGEGTEFVDGACVLVEEDNNETPVINTGFSCENTTGLHSVKGGSPRTISEWLNWTFVGGHLVTDPDNAWIQDFGAAVFNVKQVPANAWEGSYTQSGMFLTAGCEYTFTFTLRTEAHSLKPDVIVFGESTSGVSYFEQVVALNESSTTYSFTVIPTVDDYASTGVYFANSNGIVIIENVQIERNPIDSE